MTVNIFLRHRECHRNLKSRESDTLLRLYHRNYWKSLGVFLYPQNIILTQHITYSPSFFPHLNPNFPQLVFFEPASTWTRCANVSTFKASLKKKKADSGERNIWLYSTGDKLATSQQRKKKVAGLADGECWQHTKQLDPNDLENPCPSRGLHQCYRQEERNRFIGFKPFSFRLTWGWYNIFTI